MADKIIFLFVISFLFGYCSADFVELPSSITTEYVSGVDRTVVFRCRHEELLASVDWKLNGTPSRAYADVVDSFVREDGIAVDILTVPVIPAYNGTEVVCSTTVDGVTEETPAALLIITGSLSTPPVGTTTAARVTTPSPTSTPPSTTTTVTTVGTPSTVEFDMAPSPLTVAVEKEMATFVCQHSACDFITWRVNGSSLNRKLPNISNDDSQVDDAGIRVYSLSIGTLLEYNTTRVECVATFFDGSPQFTSPVTLLIQDVPGKVTNAVCKRNHTSGAHLITEWDPLPSLDLTNADPDIVYRVQWWNVTCGQNMSMGEETVNGTNTSYVIHHPHEIYEVTITPRNNIMAARDGGSTMMREKFLSLESRLFNLSRNSSMYFKDNSPVPSYYTMVLKSLDGTQSDSTVNITVQREGELVELHLEGQLPSKTLWNVSVLAHNCEADTVLEGYELSTHDIQNITISSSLRGKIGVTGYLLEESNATGLLIVAYHTSKNSDVQYNIIGIPTEGGMDTIFNVSTGGDYKVSVFALENDRPFPRVVALPRQVHVENPSDQGQLPIDFELQSTSSGVYITCTFLESSTTDCVAVVHQRISQLNSSGLMNIESSHKFTRSRSGDTASGCIEGVNLEDYQVGVVGGTLRMVDHPIPESKGSSLAVSVAVSCIIVVLVIILAVVMSLVFFVICSRKRKNRSLSESRAYSTRNAIATGFIFNTLQNALTRTLAINQVPSGESPPPIPERTEESNVLTDQALSPIHLTVTSNSISAEAEFSHDPTYDRPVFLPKPSSLASSALVTIPSCVKNDVPNTSPADVSQHYAEAIPSTSSIPHPPAADNVLYDQITGFHNPQGNHYAILGELPPTCNLVPDNLLQTQSQYSEIVHQVVESQWTGGQTEAKQVITQEEPSSAVISQTFDLDHLVLHLLPMASEWRPLGEALSLDDDHLDEIYTNNMTDEDCLRDMLERYLLRSDLKHNWEEIEEAQKNICRSRDRVEEDTDNQPSIPQSPEKSVGGTSPVGECTDSELSVQDVPLCIKADNVPPKVVGNENDERFLQLLSSESCESTLDASPSSFASLVQEDMPLTSLHQCRMICQETEDDDIDYLTALRTSTLNIQSPSRATTIDEEQEESDYPTQSSACLDTHEYSYRSPCSSALYERTFSYSDSGGASEGRYRCLHVHCMHDDEMDKGDYPSPSLLDQENQSPQTSFCWRIIRLFYPYYLIGLLYKQCSQLLVQLCLRLGLPEFNWAVLLEFFSKVTSAHTLMYTVNYMYTS